MFIADLFRSAFKISSIYFAKLVLLLNFILFFLNVWFNELFSFNIKGFTYFANIFFILLLMDLIPNIILSINLHNKSAIPQVHIPTKNTS